MNDRHTHTVVVISYPKSSLKNVKYNWTGRERVSKKIFFLLIFFSKFLSLNYHEQNEHQEKKKFLNKTNKRGKKLFNHSVFGQIIFKFSTFLLTKHTYKTDKKKNQHFSTCLNDIFVLYFVKMIIIIFFFLVSNQTTIRLD